MGQCSQEVALHGLQTHFPDHRADGPARLICAKSTGKRTAGTNVAQDVSRMRIEVVYKGNDGEAEVGRRNQERRGKR